MIRWGILGAGKIANRFAESLIHEPNSVLKAIAVRKEEKAKAFKEKFDYERYYFDYNNLIEDTEIDAIYLSLPHGLHKEWAIKALKNHKAVLCEKPAALSYEQMMEIAKVAKENNCLFMEAMKTRFVPLYEKIKELIDAGAIGKIERIETYFCSSVSEKGIQESYLSDPTQGGCLLDTGIYCASWIEDLVHEELALTKIYANIKNGVDHYVKATLQSKSKIIIDLEVALDRSKPKNTKIIGELGNIEITNHHRTQEILFTTKNDWNRKDEQTIREILSTTNFDGNRIKMPYIVDDFYGQIHHFVSLMMEHKTESEVMPLSASLNCAKILDTIKAGYTKYDENDLEVLKKQEEALQFEYFNSELALKLGQTVIELAKKMDREIAVQIIREADEAVIFQYLMDSKSARNLEFMARKRKVALACQHSSVYAAIDMKRLGKRPDYLEEGLSAAGGAFPLRVCGQWVATLLVSGLHEGKDHELIVRSLSKFLNVQVPDFKKALI